jgi:cyclic-di-GMP-binding protein
MPSFDIVSEVNFQEVDNAVNQAKKEISTRYDFRGSKSEIVYENKEIKFVADDDYKLRAMKDILESKLTKRGVSLKSLDYQKEEEGSMGAKKQTAKLINGLTKEKAKEIIAVIKDTRLKVQPTIHDEQVRVSAKSIDDLQSVIQTLKSKDVGVPLQFNNMRA